MNDLAILKQTAQTMSSREISELTGKEHHHVLRDIRAYVGAVVQMERGIDVRSMDWSGKEGVELFGYTPIGGVTMAFETNPQNGQSYPIYHLDKNATLTIISGYNILLRKRIIDRWQELETQNNALALPNFNDPVAAARAWADEVEAKQKLAITLEQAQPKINHYDKVVARNQNLLNATQVAQKLGKSAHWLNLHLELLKVYNSNVKRGRAFAQWFMDKGMGVMKQTDNGFSQPLFTLMGEAWIIQKLTEQGVV